MARLTWKGPGVLRLVSGKFVYPGSSIPPDALTPERLRAFLDRALAAEESEVPPASEVPELKQDEVAEVEPVGPVGKRRRGRPR